MVKDFNDFCFEGKIGEKKIVRTQFGYHYIEITDQKKFEPAFKIAYLSKKIEASPETDQAASGLANQFAGENRSQKAFEDAVQKKNLQKLLAPEIQPAERPSLAWAQTASLYVGFLMIRLAWVMYRSPIVLGINTL